MRSYRTGISTPMRICQRRALSSCVDSSANPNAPLVETDTHHTSADTAT
jgi:hypothetical protein